MTSNRAPLQITDIQGKPLESIQLKGRNNSVVVTLQKYAAGNYMVSLLHNSNVVETIQLLIK